MTTKETSDALVSGLTSVIQGKGPQIEIFITSYLSGGHVLIEDVPGLGKTTLAKALSRLVDSNSNDSEKSSLFKRIQFTPDLLPYDITGVDIFNPQEHRFEFMPGPVFCDILLADEINRTTPKVQSALLEVMAEKQVTSGGKTRPVSDLFFVVATQNPIESEGTYPLPAAQLDRFMTRLSLGYPDEIAEHSILHEDPSETILPHLRPVVRSADIRASREEQKQVYCHPALERAMVSIVRETRTYPSFQLGVSPRGVLHLLHLARTLALVKGRNWVVDQDIIDLAGPVLCHRIIAKEIRTDIPAILSKIISDTLRKLDKTTDWARAADKNDGK
jgi:MoxR-like ATPase